jgi:hypothetical protein
MNHSGSVTKTSFLCKMARWGAILNRSLCEFCRGWARACRLAAQDKGGGLLQVDCSVRFPLEMPTSDTTLSLLPGLEGVLAR